MWCLLSESPWITDEECEHLDDNRRLVVSRGRDPELRLDHHGRKRSIADWGHEIFVELREVAMLLDRLEEGAPHAEALAELTPWLDDPTLTPSGRLLKRWSRMAGNSSMSSWTWPGSRPSSFGMNHRRPVRRSSISWWKPRTSSREK